WPGMNATNAFNHLVTFMPRQMRFIRIDSALTNRPNMKMKDEIHALVANHRGPIYFMGLVHGITAYRAIFHGFGVRVPEDDFHMFECPYLDVALWRVER